MLETAQNASQMAGIERIFQLAGNLAGVDPAALDNVDFDFGIQKASSLLHNDPKLIRSPAMLAQMRKQKQDQMQQAQLAAHADTAQKLAQGAQTLSQTDVGGGQSALQAMMGGIPGAA
jgi:hypothetical protein